jgi:hypothetical protein
MIEGIPFESVEGEKLTESVEGDVSNTESVEGDESNEKKKEEWTLSEWINLGIFSIFLPLLILLAVCLWRVMKIILS